MNSIIVKLLEKLNNKDLLLYNEDDHYYIMSIDSKQTFILLQETDESIIVWSYSTNLLTLSQLCRYLEELSNKAVIFPEVTAHNEVSLLKSCKYKEFDFNIDDEIYKSSYIKEK